MYLLHYTFIIILKQPLFIYKNKSAVKQYAVIEAS
jgi:hypothetical protein